MISPELQRVLDAVKPRGKPLVVNHWATWCEPCVDELPYLAEVAKRFEGKVDFVGISWDRYIGSAPIEQTTAAVDAVRAKAGVRFPTVLAPKDPEAVARELKLEAEYIPQTYVFAPSGEKLWSLAGEIYEDAQRAAFEKAIESALARH